MNQENSKQNFSEVKVGNTFFEFIAITVKYRWFLFWFVFLITLGVTLYAVFAPKWYKSTASVFPAEKTDLLSSLSGLSNLAKGFSSGKGLAALTGSNTETDKYVAIVKSATLTNDVIKKFDLRKEYDYENDYYEKVVKEWESNLEVEIQDEGNLTISVYDKDKNKAADIVNYIIERLNDINTELSIQNARANKIFIEKRYLQNIDTIATLETSMEKFQQKYGVVAVPEQIEATIKSMSGIYADLYKKEIEYNVIKQTYGENYPSTLNLKLELTELQKKINQLNAGTDATQKEVNLLIPFKKAPELGNQYLKIYRNLEIQYKILEFIQPLYEQAKIEEVRNTPSVVVLDKGAPAERKAKPKIALYLLLAFVISTSVGFLLILLVEGGYRLRNIDSKRFDSMINTLKADFRRNRKQ